VDVRVIAATHQDLTAAVNQGKFRADLFFRLNVFPIRVPPLRERREDIPDLASHFVRQFARRMNRPAAAISAATMQVLLDYAWPGNVRELENIVERSMIITTGDTLQIDPHWFEATPRDGVQAHQGLAEVRAGALPRQDLRPRRRGCRAGPQTDHALRQDAETPDPAITGLTLALPRFCL
jgi:DNA-binding NtrC family response regulator